ncbi:MAG TPA: N4-gp56 family major capsid protein [Bryobacteraceae bacterium]|jgi:N4-gp56 family major capsid protein
MGDVKVATHATSNLPYYLNKKFLETVIQDVVLPKYGDKSDLPLEEGTDTIRFHKRAAASAGSFKKLAEGQTNLEYTNTTLTPVDVKLDEYYDAARVSRRQKQLSIFRAMDKENDRMIEAATLFADKMVRDELVGNVDTNNKFYAQNGANFAALSTYSAGRAIVADIDRIATQLKDTRAPKFSDGNYVGVISPRQGRDFRKDPDWKQLVTYSEPMRMTKGYVGTLFGVNIVEATQPFKQSAAEGTYDDAGTIHTGLFFGKGAFGVADLEGQGTPKAPQVNVLDKADKSDPANAWIIAVHMLWFATKTLDATWVSTLCTQTNVNA